MTDKLIIQSIGASPHDAFLRYMALEEPIHRDYAARCGADYGYFVGLKDARCNPTWNRIQMMLDAFDAGYRKIVWLDADTLVVRPDLDVFAGTSDTAAMLMTRVLGAHVEMPWRFAPVVRSAGYCGALREGGPRGEFIEDVNVDGVAACTLPPHKTGAHANSDATWANWDVYNDGVLIVNDSDHARAALTFAWEHRVSAHEPWHVPGMPELDWLLDYVFDHPDAVETLSDVWNWMGYPEGPPRDEAVILAWHGHPYETRWQKFKAAYDACYGTT